MVRNGVMVDTAARTASRDGRPLELSRKELAVLEVLASADGAVVSNDDLIERVWEAGASYQTNAVRITLSKLRKKLGQPAVIFTVPGAGYRLPVHGSLGDGTVQRPDDDTTDRR
jgi:DNA-binding response OmpR family regulator